MIQYLQRGTVFIPEDSANLNVKDELPVGNFIIKEDPQTEKLYFEQVDSFEPLKGRVYGDTLAMGDKFMNTYLHRTASTGVMLSGEKGSGKSLLAKHLSLLGYGHGMPTIIINTQMVGDKFNQLIQNVHQKCIVLFDEFEKVYDKEHQEKVLTLLDGVFPSKKLFIVTCNDKSRMDAHMINRPGRFFYAPEFLGLEESFIDEYAGEILKPGLRQHIDDIRKASHLFESFNFDILKAMCEEMNRYDETPKQVLKYLNAKPSGERGRFSTTLYNQAGVELPAGQYYPNGDRHISPLSGNLDFTWYEPTVDAKGEPDSEEREISFQPGDLKSNDKDTFFFKNKAGFAVMFHREASKSFNWDMIQFGNKKDAA